MAGSTPYSQEKKQRAVRKAPTYRPAPAWRMGIPKPDGSKRPSRQPLSLRSGISRIYSFNCFAAPVERAWHPDAGCRTGGCWSWSACGCRRAQADQWNRHWLHGQGLHKLSGTIRYPRTA